MQGMKLSAVMPGASFVKFSIPIWVYFIVCSQSYPFGYGKKLYITVVLHSKIKIKEKQNIQS